jgi:hypothetical protein
VLAGIRNTRGSTAVWRNLMGPGNKKERTSRLKRDIEQGELPTDDGSEDEDEEDEEGDDEDE